MLVALIGGVFLVILGIGAVAKASRDYKDDSTWVVGVMLGNIIITLGILGISWFSNDAGNQLDPPSPVTEHGHIYKVLDSMEFKKGYLVSFREMIPNKKKIRVRFFEKMPPSIFESAWENGKTVYIHFEPPSPNPVK